MLNEVPFVEVVFGLAAVVGVAGIEREENGGGFGGGGGR